MLVNSKLGNIGTTYRNVILEVQTITAKATFNEITVPAGTYLLTMHMVQANDVRALAWLNINGELQLATSEEYYYMLCSCNSEISSSVSRIITLDSESTLAMQNSSGHDYDVVYTELIACRLN